MVSAIQKGTCISIMNEVLRVKRLKALKGGLLPKFKYYPQFYQKVWLACSGIPEGQVKTYGWVARKIGKPGSSRAVGNALAKNPFAPRIPCHRVISSSGKLGGYSGPGGIRGKIALLKKEGIRIERNRVVGFAGLKRR